jgi:hypothetical protein
VSVTRSGSKYQLGYGTDPYGQDFCGIWELETARLVAEFPQTTRGWQDAWARYAELEAADVDALDWNMRNEGARDARMAFTLGWIGPVLAWGAGLLPGLALHYGYRARSRLRVSGSRRARHEAKAGIVLGWIGFVALLTIAATAFDSVSCGALSCVPASLPILVGLVAGAGATLIHQLIVRSR